MHALTAAGAAAAVLVLAGCRPRVSPAQCDEIVSRYAALIVKEKAPAAPPEVTAEEQNRAREEASHDEAFQNCTTEVRIEEYRCAMAAATADAVEKCLE